MATRGSRLHRSPRAVIGTGSSGVQSIPLIAEQADQVIVFQRTPSYAVPAHNEPLDPEQVAAIKADYVEWRKTARTPAPASVAIWRAGPQRDGRVGGGAAATYDARWEIGGLFFLGSFNDLLLNPESNATAASYVRERIAEIVDDPETAAMLSPDTTIGCKRLVVDTDYFRTFNRSNVSLVDVAATPVEQITETAVVVDGVHHQVDDIVFATGFDAMTGSLDRIDITGRGGRTLRAGRRARRPFWGFRWQVSRTCSPSPVPAARRCSPTWSCRSSSTSSTSVM